MRNSINSSYLAGISVEEYPPEHVDELYDVAEKVLFSELRTRFNLQSSHVYFESNHLGHASTARRPWRKAEGFPTKPWLAEDGRPETGDATARCSSREGYSAEPGLAAQERQEAEEPWQPRNNANFDCGTGRSVEKKRPATAAAARGAAPRLPEEVVERILAMVTFPDLLKVRFLSKAWYGKFPQAALAASSASSTGRGGRIDQRPGGDMGVLSPSPFLRLVSSMSTNWSVYCPVIIGNEGLIGYDPVHRKWQGLLTNLQQMLGSIVDPSLMNACGPLICGVPQSPNSEYDVFVTNALTGRSRKLPPHPSTRVPSLLNVLLDDSEGYKVFLMTEDPYEGPHDECAGHSSISQSRRCVSAQVFDSVDGTWTTSQSEVPSATSFAWRSCSVSFSGNIYCLAGDDRSPIDHPLQVWVYNLQEGIWAEISHPFGELVNASNNTSVLFDLTRFRLFVCGDKVMVALALDQEKPLDDRVGADTLRIYELDPDTRIITEKSRGPPFTVVANSEHIASDGANIYFCTLDFHACYAVIVYNIESGLWSCLAPDFKTAGPLTNKRWADFAFQPGLNPFTVP